jgi:hypothetical protein
MRRVQSVPPASPSKRPQVRLPHVGAGPCRREHRVQWFLPSRGRGMLGGANVEAEILDQLRGAGMPQEVRCHASGNACLLRIRPDHVLHSANRQRAAVSLDEQPSGLANLVEDEHVAVSRDEPFQSRGHDIIHRGREHLVALGSHIDEVASTEVDLVESQPDEFVDPADHSE